jgi:hypothetical protein
VALFQYTNENIFASMRMWIRNRKDFSAGGRSTNNIAAHQRVLDDEMLEEVRDLKNFEMWPRN